MTAGIDKSQLPLDLREALDVLSPVEVMIVRLTLAGVAAWKIAEAIGQGWTEGRVKRWRQQRGIVPTSQAETVKLGMEGRHNRGGRLRRPPTFEELQAAAARLAAAGHDGGNRPRLRSVGADRAPRYGAGDRGGGGAMGAVTAISDRPSARWRGDLMAGDRPGPQSGRLVPLEAARAVIAEVDAELVRMPTEEEVRAMLRRLIGSYRTGQVQDANVYADVLRDELAAAPLVVAARAVTEVTRRLKWPPTRAELVEAIEAERIARRALRYRAELHIREHDRRRQEAADAARRASERADPAQQAAVDRMLAAMKAKSVGAA